MPPTRASSRQPGARGSRQNSASVQPASRKPSVQPNDSNDEIAESVPSRILRNRPASNKAQGSAQDPLQVDDQDQPQAAPAAVMTQPGPSTGVGAAAPKPSVTTSAATGGSSQAPKPLKIVQQGTKEWDDRVRNCPPGHEVSRISGLYVPKQQIRRSTRLEEKKLGNQLPAAPEPISSAPDKKAVTSKTTKSGKTTSGWQPFVQDSTASGDASSTHQATAKKGQEQERPAKKTSGKEPAKQPGPDSEVTKGKRRREDDDGDNNNSSDSDKVTKPGKRKQSKLQSDAPNPGQNDSTNQDLGSQWNGKTHYQKIIEFYNSSKVIRQRTLSHRDKIVNRIIERRSRLRLTREKDFSAGLLEHLLILAFTHKEWDGATYDMALASAREFRRREASVRNNSKSTVYDYE